MANEKHGVVRTDLMSGTDVRSDLVSLKYMDGTNYADIDNGSIVEIGEFLDGERELYAAKDMTATSDIKNLVLVASPEVMYDERLDDLADFYNEAGTAARGYRLREAGNIFSVTIEALDGLSTPVVGNYVDKQAGNKALVVAASGANTFGRIAHIEKVGTRTYYAIRLI